MNERLEDIERQVKRSDEYAEKGLWEASDAWIVHLHNEGHINYLIERLRELESERADLELGHKQLSERVEELEFLEDRLEVYSRRIYDLEQQNKRYRGVIDEIREYITDCEKLDTEVVSYVIEDIIDEALEVTE